MIPFPGESLGSPDSWSSDGDDWSLAADVYHRGAYGSTTADGHRVITAGTEWRSWCFSGDTQYLEEDIPLEAAWVVEVLDGSGTLAGSDDFDTGYLYDTTSPMPHDLGTVSVTGPGTYTFPTTYTAAQAKGDESGLFAFRLECTAGSIDVQQVKLRVWPVGGAVGGWADQSAWDEPFTGSVRGADGITISEVASGAATPGDAVSAVSSALLADALTEEGTSRTFTFPAAPPSGQGTWALSGVYDFGTDTYQFSASGRPNIYALLGPNPTVDGVGAQSIEPGTDGYITPPGEVADDDTALTQVVGTPSLTWDAQTVTVSGVSVNDALPDPQASVYVDQFDRAAVGYYPDGKVVTTIPYTGAAAFTVPSGGAAASATVSVAGPAWGSIRLLVLGYRIPEEMPGASEPTPLASVDATFTVGAAISAPSGTLHHPPYRVWSPTAVVEQPLRLMQRGDGLGMGSGRVYATGTRQASTRVFGSL